MKAILQIHSGIIQRELRLTVIDCASVEDAVNRMKLAVASSAASSYLRFQSTADAYGSVVCGGLVASIRCLYDGSDYQFELTNKLAL